MKLEQLDKKTRDAVVRHAKKIGIKPEEVLSRFDQIFRGGKVSKHFRLFF